MVGKTDEWEWLKVDSYSYLPVSLVTSVSCPVSSKVLSIVLY